jgi:hypothetical protein
VAETTRPFRRRLLHAVSFVLGVIGFAGVWVPASRFWPRLSASFFSNCREPAAGSRTTLARVSLRGALKRRRKRRVGLVASYLPG